MFSICLENKFLLIQTIILITFRNVVTGFSSLTDVDTTPLMFPNFPNVVDCGMKPIQSAIVGGIHPYIGEDPWLALLKFTDKITKKSEFVCTGTLINERYVLTAAHCIDGKFLDRNDLHSVRLGEHNITTPRDSQFMDSFSFFDYPVEDYVIHPNYNDDSFFANDIALIKLAIDVDFPIYQGQINAICIPPRDFQVKEVKNMPLRTVGWNLGGGRPTDTLMQSYLKVIDETTCSKMYRGNLHYQKICTLSEDICVADSGSPLTIEDRDQSYIIGLLSITVPQACLRYPSLYTSITPHIDWLIENASI